MPNTDYASLLAEITHRALHEHENRLKTTPFCRDAKEALTVAITYESVIRHLVHWELARTCPDLHLRPEHLMGKRRLADFALLRGKELLALVELKIMHAEPGGFIDKNARDLLREDLTKLRELPMQAEKYLMVVAFGKDKDLRAWTANMSTGRFCDCRGHETKEEGFKNDVAGPLEFATNHSTYPAGLVVIYAPSAIARSAAAI